MTQLHRQHNDKDLYLFPYELINYLNEKGHKFN